MDTLFWDGLTGYATKDGITVSLANKPAISCDQLDYSDGAGTMTIGEITTPIDATTSAEIEAILTELTGMASAPPPQAYGVDANGKYLGLVDATLAVTILSHPLPAGKAWNMVDGQWVAEVSLDEAQGLAQAQVDTAAGTARLRYITDVPGQQAVYLTKLEQAQAWVANPTGPVPPYVAAEAAAMGSDATTGANNIITTAVAWNTELSPTIEQYRRAGKLAIMAASSNEDVATQLVAAVAKLNSL